MIEKAVAEKDKKSGGNIKRRDRNLFPVCKCLRPEIISNNPLLQRTLFGAPRLYSCLHRCTRRECAASNLKRVTGNEKNIFSWVCEIGRQFTTEFPERYDRMLMEERDKKKYRHKGHRQTTIKTVYGRSDLPEGGL